MKKLCTLAVLALLVSCGKHETKYVENPYNNSENEEHFKELENRILVLEQATDALINQMEVNYTNNIAVNNSLQASINALIQQMVQLQSHDSVVALVDPCPNISSSGYKETLLKTSSGKLIAYFENGSQRFLSQIVAGNYRTTDSRACNFTVNGDYTIGH